MLDVKHKNIGSTVGMIKDIHKIGDKGELAEGLTELFMEEAKDCDFRHETGACVFNGSTETNLRCQVGNCPLGKMVDDEIDDNPFNFGCDPDSFPFATQGSHIHIGYTGWRKWWYNNRLTVGIVVVALSAFLLCLW